MNILFITLVNILDIDERNIYSDLVRELARKGEEVYVVSPVERRFKEKSRLIEYLDYSDWHKRIHILKIKTGNIQKTGFIEKGLSTIAIETKMKRGLKKFFRYISFHLILYSTPPITLVKPISYIKIRDNAKTYLMLKDINPQSFIDLGALTKKGLKGVIYRFFRNKEKKLYALSDKIGCMSQANVDYVLKNNPDIDKSKVEIFPNCIEPLDVSLTTEQKVELRIKYGIPLNKKVFIYGGNIGKPQGVPFIIDCLKAEKENNSIFFLIIGDGTEYSKLEFYLKDSKQANFKLMKKLPKEDYDKVVASCDVGMIFLDHRFTIPNFPSRLLSYMQAGLPVLACTDTNSDVGKVIVDGGFGWWCESNDVDAFDRIVRHNCSGDLSALGMASKSFLHEHYSVKANYELLIK